MMLQASFPVHATTLKTFHFGPGHPAAAGKARSAAPKPPARPPLPAFARARLRAKVAAITCSDAWTELAAESAEKHGINPNIANVAHPLGDRGIYPPKPDPGPDHLPRVGAVRMRRCHACGRIVPPNNLASYKLVRLCDDCRIQPDVHPDEIDQKPTCARAPGAHLRQWIEGVTYEIPHLGNPRKQLMQIGLNDSEITAMALVFAGYSTRRVGAIGHWSQAYVRKLIKSAANKLQRSGLPVPKAPPAGRQRHRPFAPITIQKLADGTD